MFDRQLRLLKRFFKVLPLLEATRRLSDGTLPQRAACITFDDGYVDNVEVAMPLLLQHGLPACFFIASGYLDGGQMWNDSIIETVRNTPGEMLDLSGFDLDQSYFEIGTPKLRRKAISTLLANIKYLPFEQREIIAEKLREMMGKPVELMMKSHHVAMLHRVGMEIGAHTASHPILTTLSEHAASTNVAEGKMHLESITKKPVDLFAYPNGMHGLDYGERDVGIIKMLGFKAAVATNWGVARQGSDIFCLPRFTPWDHNPQRFLLRLWQNLFRPLP